MRAQDRSEQQADPQRLNGPAVSLWDASGELLRHLSRKEAREMVSKGIAWVVNRSTIALCELE